MRVWRNWNPCAVGRNVKWCSHYEEQYGGSQKKLKLELPCDSAILSLGTYLKELKSGSQRDISAPMFTVALFTIDKMRKQQKFSTTDKL